ncbi:hypothetical protein [Endozoicomonas ascidiicola]|uniref:hypothetical protein n=1 Tax=Endozoicomonas ascidiicola TaxID=1698521 RepID=UPI00082CE7FA|nr:hypothetical protein [Endozoicomonas ascidiicola]
MHITKGNIPGADILVAIQRSENVSTNWLLEEKGSPYIVANFETDLLLAEELQAHAEDGIWENVYIFTDGRRVVIELTTPAYHEYKGKGINYTAREFMAGPFGDETLHYLWDSFADKRLYICYMEPEPLNGIATGRVGPYQIHGDGKTLGLYQPEPVNDRDLSFGQLQTVKPVVEKGEVSITLMRAVMQMVKQLQADEGVSLNLDDEIKVIAAAYKHAVKKNLAPADLDPLVVQGMIDVL